MNFLSLLALPGKNPSAVHLQPVLKSVRFVELEHTQMIVWDDDVIKLHKVACRQDAHALVVFQVFFIAKNILRISCLHFEQPLVSSLAAQTSTWCKNMFAVDPDTSSSSVQVYVLHVVCLLGNEISGFIMRFIVRLVFVASHSRPIARRQVKPWRDVCNKQHLNWFQSLSFCLKTASCFFYSRVLLCLLAFDCLSKALSTMWKAISVYRSESFPS